MNENNKYLYRGLRKEEIDAGNILIPKSQEPFRCDPRFDIDMIFPIQFGSQENAIRQHQWKQNGFTTSGISTSPHFKRAKFYAKNKIIVKINRDLLSHYGIEEYIVNDWLKKRPEDDEVILVNENCQFPKEIIEEAIKVK